MLGGNLTSRMIPQLDFISEAPHLTFKINK